MVLIKLSFMKKLLVLLFVIITGSFFAFSDNQRFVVANKDGKARLILVENEGDKWKYVQPIAELHVENGTELTGFEIPEDKSLNYTGTPYIYNQSLIVEYEGKNYLVVSPKKNVKPIDENGNMTSDLGIRNYLSNTILGDFYRTEIPGIIGLVCAIISLIFLLASIHYDVMPTYIKWGAMLPICLISLLEIGASFSVGTEAAWWVNPDDVGFWIATPLLIPYFLIATLMFYSISFYKYLGKINGWLNIVIYVLLIIGIILTTVSVILVVCNFLAALLPLLGLAYLFRGFDYKDAAGNTINVSPLGTYKTDSFGHTTRIS